MKLEKLEQKWKSGVEDDFTTMSDEAAMFVRDFRSVLKELLPMASIKIRGGHYCLSGFITSPDGFITYISYSIPRGRMPIRFDCGGALFGVLYRSARDENDFRGGLNHFCSINEMGTALKTFVNRDHEVR